MPESSGNNLLDSDDELKHFPLPKHVLRDIFGDKIDTVA